MRGAERTLYEEAKAAEKSGRRSLAAQRYSQLSVRFRERGELAKSRKALDRALKLAGDSPRLFVQLAVLCLAERNPQGAEDAVHTFAELVADRPERRDEYGKYFDRYLSAFPGLRAIFRAESGAPKETPPQGQLFAVPEDGDSSEPEIERAQRTRHTRATSSDGASLHELIKRLEDQLGEDPLSVRQEPNLEAFFRAVGRHVTGDAVATGDLAVAFAMMGLASYVARLADGVDEAARQYGSIQCVAGRALLDDRQWLEALDRFQRARRALVCPPEVEAEAEYGCVVAYAQLGDTTLALERLAILETTFPQYRDIADWKERLLRERSMKGGS